MKDQLIKIFRDVFFFFIVFYIAFMLHSALNYYYHPIIRSKPELQTKYILGVVARVIDENLNGPPLHSSRDKLRNWVNNYLNFFLPNPNWRPQKYFPVKDNFCDFWGNSLNIEYINNFPKDIPTDRFTPLKGNLVIWSSGKNGVDEWGQGDDIVYRKD